MNNAYFWSGLSVRVKHNQGERRYEIKFFTAVAEDSTWESQRFNEQGVLGKPNSKNSQKGIQEIGLMQLRPAPLML